MKYIFAWIFVSCLIFPAVEQKAEAQSITVQFKDIIAGYSKDQLQQMYLLPFDSSLAGPSIYALHIIYPIDYKPQTKAVQNNVFDALSGNVTLDDRENLLFNYIWDKKYCHMDSTGPVCDDKDMYDNPLDYINLGSLMNPLAYYSDQEKKKANMAMSSMLGHFNSSGTSNFKELVQATPGDDVYKKIEQLLDSKMIHFKLAGLRAHFSVQTLAFNNLYHVYKERELIDIQKDAQIVSLLKNEWVNKHYGKDKKQLSRAEAKQIMAMRRVSDESWYKNLEKDNSTALLRQMVVLLAEQSVMQYENNVLLERLLAMQSASLLYTTSLNKASFYNPMQK